MKNSGNSPATNVFLTFQTRSQILTTSVFSTENYTVINDRGSVLQLSIPRLSNGNGSLISIDVNTSKLTDISDNHYTMYLTHDKSSLMIDSPTTSVKTVKNQAITTTEIYQIIGVSGLLGTSQFSYLG